MGKRVYGLKTINSDYTSYGGFKWKKWNGEPYVIKADDWNEEKDCGGGIHFALNGEGNGGLFDWAEDALWVVVEANEKSIIDLDGKVKSRAVKVLYIGNRKTATDMIYKLCGMRVVIGGTATAGEYGTATAGNFGTATAGDEGIATAGEEGMLCWKYYDKNGRPRQHTEYIGENGIKANIKYQGFYDGEKFIVEEIKE